MYLGDVDLVLYSLFISGCIVLVNALIGLWVCVRLIVRLFSARRARK